MCGALSKITTHYHRIHDKNLEVNHKHIASPNKYLCNIKIIHIGHSLTTYIYILLLITAMLKNFLKQ